MSTQGHDDPESTPTTSSSNAPELDGLNPQDLLAAGLQSEPLMTRPPQAPDGEATMPVSRPQPTQPPAAQVELPTPEELTTLLPGGNYHAESFLGQGGMGAVYKGQQVRLKRPVAIKIMRRDFGKDYDFEARFEREAQAMAKLNHPNIVSVIDYGEAGTDYLYIVMELVDGADLMDVIRTGRMTQEMALTLLPQICDALQFAHDHGIVHRDIKPSNIMLTRDGRIKMADFGLAKRFDTESSFRTQTGTGMGTPDYAAPEQFDAHAPIDHRADIYALGVMIYQMITGSLPRGVWKPPSQRAEIDPHWDDIVSRAMQSDPKDRYQQASEMKTDVSSIPLAGKEQSAGVPSGAAQPARPSSKGSAAAKHNEARNVPILEANGRPPARSRVALAFGTVVIAIIAFVAVFYGMRGKQSSAGLEPAPSATLPGASKPTTPSSMPAPQASGDGLKPGTTLAAVQALPESGWKPLLDGEEWKKHWPGKREIVDGLLHLTMQNVTKPLPGADGAVRARVVFREGSEHVAVLARSSGGNETYKLNMRTDGVFLSSIGTDGKNLEKIGSASFPKPLKPGDKVTLELRVQGDRLTALVDGKVVIEGRNATYSKPGAWGIMANDGWFESADVQPLPATAAPLSPNLPTSKSSDPKFPPGQWVKLFTKPEDLPADLRKPDSGVKWEDGWIRCGSMVRVLQMPLGTTRNVGVRLTSRRQGAQENITDIILRNNSDGTSRYQVGIKSGGTMFGAQKREQDGYPLLWTAPLPKPNKVGDICRLEFAAVGSRLVGRFDNTVFQSAIDTSITKGGVSISTAEDIRDIEVINLDGLPEAEALRLLGVDEKGNDLRGKATGRAAAPSAAATGPAATNPPNAALAGASALPSTATKDAPFINSLGMKFVPVPITGGPTEKQRVLFSIWETRAQDYAVFAKATAREPASAEFKQGPDEGVVMINFPDAQAFCAWLTERERTSGQIDDTVAYRLPTDHEWSCAAGIGQQEDANTPPAAKNSKILDLFLWGREWPPSSGAGNFAGEELAAGKGPKVRSIISGYRDGYLQTSPVGAFRPDASGLFDLAGNAREWCLGAVDGQPDLGILRGAAWNDAEAPRFLISCRQSHKLDLKNVANGFRVVLAPASNRSLTSAVAPATATKDAPFVNTLGMKFVPVPILDGPTKGQRVLFSTWETRERDYEAFVSDTKREWSGEGKAAPKGPDFPAVWVKRDDAQAFCAWLTERERKGGRISTSESYRLPTDYEWGCAIGIGDRPDQQLPVNSRSKIVGTPWSVWPPPAGAGNFGGEELTATYPTASVIAGYRDGFVTRSPVGSFPADLLGLFDLMGNVQEWVEDDLVPGEGILRGGSFYSPTAPALDRAWRYHTNPIRRADESGFRIVLAPAPAAAVSLSPSLPVSQSSIATATKAAPFVNTLGMKFVPVPITGGPTDGKRVLFSVWETRVQDYETFVKETKRKWDTTPFPQTPLHPALRVTWDDANAFNQWLTARDRAAGIISAGEAYRLPSDHEWSCAAGIGDQEDASASPRSKDLKIQHLFPWGTAWPPPPEAGNFAGTEASAAAAANPKGWLKEVMPDHRDEHVQTAPVGSYPADARGIFDLSGNVMEWCRDAFEADKETHEVRGSCYIHYSRNNFLSSKRSRFPATVCNDVIGFRSVLAPAETVTPQVGQ